MEAEYCSFCSGKLRARSYLDVYGEGYICENGHKSHILLKDVGQNLAGNNNQYRLCGKSEPRDIIIAWLTEDPMRKYLYDQFAEFLIVHLELVAGNKLNTIIPGYSWCPICGEKLHKFPTDDVYIVTSKCKNEHTWNSRGSLWQEKPFPNYKLDISYETYLRHYQFYIRVLKNPAIEQLSRLAGAKLGN